MIIRYLDIGDLHLSGIIPQGQAIADGCTGVPRTEGHAQQLLKRCPGNSDSGTLCKLFTPSS